jgi:hypothetical protein
MKRPNLLPLGAMARRVHVPSKWLRSEAEAGRIPHLKADTQLLFNPNVVEKLLALRAQSTGDGESLKQTILGGGQNG